jgi:TP901 family phage tail tape measure protein
MSKSMNMMGRSARDVGSRMTMRLTLPILGLGIASAKTAIDMQSGFIGVQKTVNASAAELNKMREEFKQMSTEIPVSVNELFKLGEAAGQLGIKTENITAFAKTISMLAATTNIAGEEGAMQLAQFANITQMSQGDFDRLGATIVELGNNTATTEAKILAMSLNLASAGSVIGMSEDQIVSFAAAASSVGLEAAMGGTAFSRTMLKMNDAVDMGGSKLRTFAKVAGLSSAEFRKRFKTDAAGALVDFTEGLGRLKTEGVNVSQVLASLGMKEVRVRDAMLRAAGAGDKFRVALALGSKGWKENTALIKEAELRFGSWDSQLAIAWNKTKLIANEVGKILVPAFLMLTKIFIPILGIFNKMPKPLKVILVVLAGLLALMPLLLMGLGVLGMSLSAIIGVISAPGLGLFLAMLGTFAAPVILTAIALTAVAVAIAEIATNWKSLKGDGFLLDLAGWMMGVDPDIIGGASGGGAGENEAVQKAAARAAAKKSGNTTVDGEIRVSAAQGSTVESASMNLNTGSNIGMAFASAFGGGF